MRAIESQPSDRKFEAEVALLPSLNEILWRRNRWIDLTMLQVYAHAIVSVLDSLRALEQETRFSVNTPASQQRRMETLGLAAEGCRILSLGSATKQLLRMAEASGRAMPLKDFVSMVAELRLRITEDLADKVFYCVTDGAVVMQFFRRNDPSIDDDETLQPLSLLPKRAYELFDASISKRFAETISDVEDAARCFVFEQYTACIFHLMRVVEHGVMRLGALLDSQDPKPSWGAILKRVEKYALYTEFKDLPVSLQPHKEFLRQVLPRMQAIQHAWRNKVDHVGSRLIPTEATDAKTASEIMTATEAFMRALAKELP